MNCRYEGRDRPRVLPERHGDECRGESCTGCLPCPESHCRVCGIAHSDGACPECLASTRDDLREIGRLCDALPEEVEHRGVNGEAMVLLGPAADPEARGHIESAYMSGRLPEGWIEAAHGKGCPLMYNEACTGCKGPELHPLIITGKWDAVWREALEHDEPDERLTVASAIEYLDRQMTYMAGFEHVPFSDFATDVRDCRKHLESVLHNQERGVRANVPCFDCGGELERKLGKAGFDDHWTCGGCRRRYTIAEYNFALRASLERAQEPAAEVPA